MHYRHVCIEANDTIEQWHCLSAKCLREGPEIGTFDITKALGTGIELLPGRPDMRRTVMVEVQAAEESSIRLAVLTYGPSQMVDECRESVFELMKGGYQDIEYFEGFGW